ncbi:MAG: SPASM domain-containing protein [bacterium]|jgi:uncharacterized protein
MKASRYNQFISLPNGGRLLFNSASAALAEIYPEEFPLIEELLSGKRDAATDKERAILEALLEGKYLIDEGEDEITAQRNWNRKRRSEPDTFVLTIAPTLACNFRCEYCFEPQRPEIMKEAAADAVLKFSERYIPNSKAILLTWFGGEPTLAVPVIEKLQMGFQSLAARHNVTLHPASIITNGYLLDRAMARRLAAVGVTGAQITLDGPAEIHDRRRKLHNGNGTFDRIIQNLKEIKDILKILVRVNIDKDNFDAAFSLVEILRREEILDSVFLYFSHVNNSTAVCADMNDRCLSTEEFAHRQVELYSRLVERGFYQIEYPSLAPGGHCGADTEASFVVVPNGDLFKCWEEVGMDSRYAVGNVFREEIHPHERANLKRYLDWDPFESGECAACHVLPLCMGGCPHHRKPSGNGNTLTACTSWKFNLDDMMRLRYQCDLMKGGE